MMEVGFLFNRENGLEGNKGIYFDYILASNGVFIQAENSRIFARIPIAMCELRGLCPIETKFALTYGSIPRRFWDLALDVFLTDPHREHYVAVTAHDGYHFLYPEQEKEVVTVVYKTGDDLVLDLHSHGELAAGFSTQDNEDERGLRFFGVVGRLDKNPVAKFRLGVYGYFLPLSWKDIFDGPEYEFKENLPEEVITEIDIRYRPAFQQAEFPDIDRWLRGDWWLRR